MRYFVYSSFKGTHYHGWQKQQNANSVQSEIESALTTVLQEKQEIVGAGRTDTGVHAKCMVFHFETEQKINRSDLSFHLNSILPHDIAIVKIVPVKEDFHARFSATSRTYHYLISQQKDPFAKDLSYFNKTELDLDKMNQAAEFLLGEKDFSCFSKSHTQTFTNNCEITEAYWLVEEEHDLLKFKITANRFLRNMVRAIVGTLIEVGQGKRKPESMEELIASKDRKLAGTSVPAQGLYLSHIEYPSEGFI